jgi:hypothetical protein
MGFDSPAQPQAAAPVISFSHIVQQQSHKVQQQQATVAMTGTSIAPAQLPSTHTQQATVAMAPAPQSASIVHQQLSMGHQQQATVAVAPASRTGNNSAAQMQKETDAILAQSRKMKELDPVEATASKGVVQGQPAEPVTKAAPKPKPAATTDRRIVKPVPTSKKTTMTSFEFFALEAQVERDAKRLQVATDTLWNARKAARSSDDLQSRIRGFLLRRRVDEATGGHWTAPLTAVVNGDVQERPTRIISFQSMIRGHIVRQRLARLTQLQAIVRGKAVRNRTPEDDAAFDADLEEAWTNVFETDNLPTHPAIRGFPAQQEVQSSQFTATSTSEQDQAQHVAGPATPNATTTAPATPNAATAAPPQDRSPSVTPEWIRESIPAQINEGLITPPRPAPKTTASGQALSVTRQPDGSLRLRIDQAKKRIEARKETSETAIHASKPSAASTTAKETAPAVPKIPGLPSFDFTSPFTGKLAPPPPMNVTGTSSMTFGAAATNPFASFLTAPAPTAMFNNAFTASASSLAPSVFGSQSPASSHFFGLSLATNVPLDARRSIKPHSRLSHNQPRSRPLVQRTNERPLIDNYVAATAPDLTQPVVVPPMPVVEPDYWSSDDEPMKPEQETTSAPSLNEPSHSGQTNHLPNSTAAEDQAMGNSPVAEPTPNLIQPLVIAQVNFPTRDTASDDRAMTDSQVVAPVPNLVQPFVTAQVNVPFANAAADDQTMADSQVEDPMDNLIQALTSSQLSAPADDQAMTDAHVAAPIPNLVQPLVSGLHIAHTSTAADDQTMADTHASATIPNLVQPLRTGRINVVVSTDTSAGDQAMTGPDAAAPTPNLVQPLRAGQANVAPRTAPRAQPLIPMYRPKQKVPSKTAALIPPLLPPLRTGQTNVASGPVAPIPNLVQPLPTGQATTVAFAQTAGAGAAATRTAPATASPWFNPAQNGAAKPAYNPIPTFHRASPSTPALPPAPEPTVSPTGVPQLWPTTPAPTVSPTGVPQIWPTTPTPASAQGDAPAQSATAATRNVREPRRSDLSRALFGRRR